MKGDEPSLLPILNSMSRNGMNLISKKNFLLQKLLDITFLISEVHPRAVWLVSGGVVL